MCIVNEEHWEYISSGSLYTTNSTLMRIHLRESRESKSFLIVIWGSTFECHSPGRSKVVPTGQLPLREIQFVVHSKCGNKVLREKEDMPTGVSYCPHCRVDLNFHDYMTSDVMIFYNPVQHVIPNR